MTKFEINSIIFYSSVFCLILFSGCQNRTITEITNTKTEPMEEELDIMEMAIREFFKLEEVPQKPCYIDLKSAVVERRKVNGLMTISLKSDTVRNFSNNRRLLEYCKEIGIIPNASPEYPQLRVVLERSIPNQITVSIMTGNGEGVGKVFFYKQENDKVVLTQQKGNIIY